MSSAYFRLGFRNTIISFMRPVPYKRCKSLEDKIVKRIREGASFSDAPRLEGIDESSFRRWRKCEREEGENDLTLRDKRCWVCAHCALQRKCDEAKGDFKQTCASACGCSAVRRRYVRSGVGMSEGAQVSKRRFCDFPSPSFHFFARISFHGRKILENEVMIFDVINLESKK